MPTVTVALTPALKSQLSDDFKAWAVYFGSNGHPLWTPLTDLSNSVVLPVLPGLKLYFILQNRSATGGGRARPRPR